MLYRFRTRTLFAALVAFLPFVAYCQWQNDLLGNGYEMRYVTQPNDYSGPVRATIVRKLSDCVSDKAILYIHGYNDYFFQVEEGDRFIDSCYNFYAVDLRKYGRSIMDGQRKFQVRNLNEYFADIDSAITQIKSDGNSQIIIMGHSAGGLISALYLNASRDTSIKGLILNSPFLDWNLSSFNKHIAIPAVKLISGIFPNINISQGDINLYAQSLLKKYYGEWDYNTDWKTEKPESVQSSWLKAISNGQKLLNKKSNIQVPILLLHSSASVNSNVWTDEYLHADGVLNVDDISKRGNRLGSNVTESTIEGALHDVMLSNKASRESAYKAVFDWLKSIDI
jgi:alpha-beta hydrolase superfamily lysophospholipase